MSAQTLGTCGSFGSELIIKSRSRSVRKKWHSARRLDIYLRFQHGKSYKIYVPETSKIIASRDLNLDESGPTILQATISENKVDDDALSEISYNDGEASSEYLDYSQALIRMILQTCLST